MKPHVTALLPLVFVFTSCCLRKVRVQPSVEFDNSAKSMTARSVGVGLDFEFNDWCPSKDFKAQLKKFASESEQDRQRFREDKISLERYNQLQTIIREATINYISLAQMAAIPERKGAVPTTTVKPVLADGKLGSAEATVTQKSSAKEQKDALVDAAKIVEAEANKEQ
jgi:hypothetical protein